MAGLFQSHVRSMLSNVLDILIVVYSFHILMITGTNNLSQKLVVLESSIKHWLPVQSNSQGKDWQKICPEG